MRISRHWPIILSILALMGCNSNPLDVDVSHIEVNMGYGRLDQELFALDPTAGKTDTKTLQDKYGEFFTLYSEGVLQLGNPEDGSFPFAVAQFITNENMLTLHSDVEKQFGNLEGIEEQLTDGFRHFKYHFPDSLVPNVVFVISALNNSVIASKTTLGIGLDMFLGADYPVYPLAGFPKYMFDNMKPDQVVPQAMKGWLQSMFETEAERKTLLDHMVFEGKLLYALDATLRNTEDSVKVGFSPYAMEWCQTYEPRIWAHLVDEELLYTTDYMTINKWINQAPFVAGIPKDSPGRLGQWVGWQIVRKYMQENPNISLQQLMLNQNAQDILAHSKYKPKL
ncbi:MAG: hypothetical protein GC178_04570 [Flavobacteriales bacterium]|nr:hypothetical protein [Flavobacteriales bacterium]